MAQHGIASLFQIQVRDVGQTGLSVGVPFVAVPSQCRSHAVIGRGHRSIRIGGSGTKGIVLVDRCPIPFANAFVVAGGTQTGWCVQTFLKHLFAHFDCFFSIGGIGSSVGNSGIEDTPMPKPCSYTGWLQRKWYAQE